MPNVNGRKFPYTPEGMEAARLARVVSSVKDEVETVKLKARTY